MSTTPTLSATLVHGPKSVAKPQPEEAQQRELRRYIYCVIDCDEPGNFDCDPIGDGSRDIHTVVHNGIGAVVSPTSQEKFIIDRQNTLAHQRVMEHIMEQGHTVLPVKFDTIAEEKDGRGPEERIVAQVLAKRFDEFYSLLGVMKTRVEMGIKALWRDMNTILWEIVNANVEIKRLRSKIVRGSGWVPMSSQGPQKAAQFGPRVKLGELVKKSLDTKKEREQKALLDAVRDIVVDSRKNKTFGDQMFTNLALLVEKSRIEELDRKLDELEDAGTGRIKLKYVGPVPPSNFVELVIRWED